MNWRQHWHTTKSFSTDCQFSIASHHNSQMAPLQNITSVEKATSRIKPQKQIQLNVGHQMVLHYQEIWQQGTHWALPRKNLPSIRASSNQHFTAYAKVNVQDNKSCGMQVSGLLPLKNSPSEIYFLCPVSKEMIRSQLGDNLQKHLNLQKYRLIIFMLRGNLPLSLLTVLAFKTT